jgi:ribonuclease P protein component
MLKLNFALYFYLSLPLFNLSGSFIFKAKSVWQHTIPSLNGFLLDLNLMSLAPRKLSIIKQRREFLAVKSGSSQGSTQGSTWGTPGFLLQACVREGQIEDKAEGTKAEARFGITVTNNTVRRMITQIQKGQQAKNKDKSSNADGKRGPVSVMRNKMRRRLKEALRQIAPDAAKPGIDYVIIGRQACLSIDYADLLKDLEKSFKKVHRRIISSGTD